MTHDELKKTALQKPEVKAAYNEEVWNKFAEPRTRRATKSSGGEASRVGWRKGGKWLK
jgi:hypothetical protein